MRSGIPVPLAAALALVLVTSTPSSSSEIATALVHTGGPLAGTNRTVETIHGYDTNSLGGYVVHVVTTDGKHRLWGAPLGGTPSILRTATGPTTFEGRPKLGDDGSVLYVQASGGDRELWRDDLRLVGGGDPYPPVPGSSWLGPNFRTVDVPSSGPVWAGGFVSPPTAYGVWTGTTPTPYLHRDDVIPDVPWPIGNPRTSTFRFSRDGAHSIGIVNLPDSGSHEALTFDRAGVIAAGAPLRAGVVIPFILGGNGISTFEGFSSGDVNDSGQWVAGFFDDGSGISALLLNGTKIRRAGDTVLGTLLAAGPFGGSRINDDGDILSLWGSGSFAWNEFAQYVDLRHAGSESIVLRTLDPVDLDGDLQPDPQAVFFRLWSDGAELNVELSNRRADQSVSFFVTAWVDTAGTTGFQHEIGDDVVAILRFDTTPPVGSPEVEASGRGPVAAWPNPMSGSLEFSVSLDRTSHVELAIYDVRGVLVDRVLDESRPTGVHRVTWDAAGASSAASGVLFYRARIDGVESGGKIVRVK